MITLTRMRCGAASAVIAVGLLTQACDRKVAESTRTEQTPNGTKVEKKTVTEHNDGTVTEQKETLKTNNP
jgi:hypothetical protein